MSKNAKSKKAEIFEVVRRFLREDKFEAVPVDDLIGAEIADPRGPVKLVFMPDEEYDFLQLWAAPEQADEIPAASRPAVMEYLTRVNAELVFGNFYLDLDSGEWGFRIAVDFSKSTLSTEMIASMFYCANERIQQYAPGIDGILAGKSVAEATAAWGN